MVLYENNDVVITSEKQDQFESKININGKNLIWISLEQQEDFQNELTNLLDKYRI